MLFFLDYYWLSLTRVDVARCVRDYYWSSLAKLCFLDYQMDMNCCRWPVFFSAIIKNHKTVNFFDAIDGHWSDNLRWLHPRPKLLGLKRNAIFFIIAFVTALRHPVTRHVIELWLYIVWTVWFLYDNQYINSPAVEYIYLNLTVCFSRKCSDRHGLCIGAWMCNFPAFLENNSRPTLTRRSPYHSQGFFLIYWLVIH